MNEARFWQRVRKIVNGCWEWQGARTGHGYGNVFWQSCYVSAHRVAWLLTQGPIPDGLCVLHKCDNRTCVNPIHLWLGTKQENSLDCSHKGRRYSVPARCMARGERHGIARLSEAAVLSIRQEYDGRRGTKTLLAHKHNVCLQTICNVIDGKIWRHVPSEVLHGV